jgi:aryl-alcohol dehydrogenase-like predicted oxidoreductase
MLNKFGFGLAAIGRPGYINLGHAEDLNNNYSIPSMRAHAHQLLDVAWENGIRYFDAARSYGRAEEFLSSWLRKREIDPNEIRVGSKWGYTYTAAWQVQTPEGVQHEVKRHELDVLKKQFQASWNNLSPYLDLYQIHSATIESGVLENEEVMNCLNGLRESGTAIGLSVSGVNQAATIEKALTVKFENELLFSSVQATWNLLEQSATSALQAAHQAGLNVIVKESLANGRLTLRNNVKHFAARKQLLEETAKELNSSIDALSIAAALNQPWATTVLCGAANETHLRSNLKACDIEWSDSLSNQLDGLTQNPQEYWAERSKMDWN